MLNQIIDWLIERVSRPSFREFLTDSLVELCSIKTIPTDNLKATADNEQKALDYIKELLAKHAPMGILEETPIAEGLQRLSQLVTEFPQIQELDINPYVVGPEGTTPIAVDARMSVEQV